MSTETQRYSSRGTNNVVSPQDYQSQVLRKETRLAEKEGFWIYGNDGDLDAVDETKEYQAENKIKPLSKEPVSLDQVATILVNGKRTDAEGLLNALSDDKKNN